MVIYRRLTAEQKALVLSYAELDKDVDGTINGLTQTKTGKENILKRRFLLNLLVFVGNRVVNEDDYPLLKSIRKVLSYLPIGSKKVADKIDEQETDTEQKAKAKKQKSSN